MKREINISDIKRTIEKCLNYAINNGKDITGELAKEDLKALIKEYYRLKEENERFKRLYGY